MNGFEIAVLVGLVLNFLAINSLYRRLDKIETFLQNIWNKLNGFD